MKKKKNLKTSSVRRLTQPSFPIAAIGGSAGGLEAFKILFSHLPTDTGMAYVVLQHLDPKHRSMATEIFTRTTQIPVIEIKDKMRAEPNHIYVMPPNCTLDFARGDFQLLPRSEARGKHMPLDFFFQALAREQGRLAIGVVLSGIDSDGTQGLAAIKAEGGITLVQDPSSAKYGEMPRSAINFGTVDLIRTPEGLADELVRIAKHPYLLPQRQTSLKPDEDLKKIFALLRNTTNADFTHYKHSTIQRRIARRMLLQKTENFGKYARFLETHPGEMKALFADILIHVTGFFRDAKVFETLKTRILPKYMKNRDRSQPFRVWVPGCSTGEEAYSIAMTFMEYLDEGAIRVPLSVFATDISEQALQKARTAIYPESISQDISKERLRRFFEKVNGGGYRITKWLRDTCLFSRHDVTRDPPFAKVDLISCRNLLIYFDSELQKRVIPIFHYALNPDGLLLLGRSETIGSFSNFFDSLDKSNKVYLKKNVSTPLKFQFPISRYSVERLGAAQKVPETLPDRIDIQREAERIALSEYAPPSVVVNDALDIVQTRGRTAPFLELSPGLPSLNLLRMAHPELIADLQLALQTARKKNVVITKERLSIHDDEGVRNLTIRVVPIPISSPSKDHYFSIFFEELKGPLHLPKKEAPTAKRKELSKVQNDKKYLEMQKKLSANQEYQQALIEEYETTQEELVSSNEELQSTNEELQSTNEELETAKEELQSTNEELTTVNDEMQTRNTEIAQINNDLTNLLASVDIPIVMVSHDGKIRRFTPKAGKALKLILTDIGRPIGDIKPNIQVPDLDQLVAEVMDSITPKEIEIQDKQGHWYQLQVRPYRTSENKIDGAVIALLDIDKLKRNAEDIKKASEELKAAAENAEAVIQAQPIPLLVLGVNQCVRLANRAFCEKFRASRSETEGKGLAEVGEGQWNIPRLLSHLEETITLGAPFLGFEVEHYFPQIGRKVMILNASRVRLAGSSEFACLLAIEDITGQKEIEKERTRLLAREQNARYEAERANLVKDEFLATLSHELRTPLTTILSWAQMLRMGRLDSEKAKRGAEILEASARAQGQLIDDLLDVSRIRAGKLNLKLQRTDPRKVVFAAIDSVRSLATRKSIQIETQVDPAVETVFADPTRLQQILWNIINNSIKFSPEHGKVSITLNRFQNQEKEFLKIQVRDQGKGIRPEFLPVIFNRFSQADSSTTRAHGGLGLGLAIVRKLVEMHDGTVSAESPGEGKGATFTVFLPIRPEKKINHLQPADQPEVPSSFLQGLSVLVVEDEEAAREAITLMIQSLGANVKPAPSVEQAVAILAEFKPDVIVSDIAMPKEDGFSLLRKVREMDGTLREIPAIALTAYAGEEDVKRTLAAGFQLHLAKPVDFNELARAIRQLAKT